MSTKSEKVIIHKVKPYPIESTLEQEGKKIPGQILKLTLKGFIMDMKRSVVQVGKEYEIIFELPVLREYIRSKCKVIKTYDQSTEAEGTQRRAEMHFLGLDEEYHGRIKKFLVSIGQTSKDF